ARSGRDRESAGSSPPLRGAGVPQPTFLAIQRPYFVLGYPFLMDRLRPRLQEMGELREGTLPREAPISSAFDLAEVDCLFYSGGRLTDACVAAATRLKA